MLSDAGSTPAASTNTLEFVREFECFCPPFPPPPRCLHEGWPSAPSSRSCSHSRLVAFLNIPLDHCGRRGERRFDNTITVPAASPFTLAHSCGAESLVNTDQPRSYGASDELESTRATAFVVATARFKMTVESLPLRCFALMIATVCHTDHQGASANHADASQVSARPFHILAAPVSELIDRILLS